MDCTDRSIKSVQVKVFRVSLNGYMQATKMYHMGDNPKYLPFKSRLFKVSGATECPFEVPFHPKIAFFGPGMPTCRGVS